jgi:hypothetical protein
MFSNRPVAALALLALISASQTFAQAATKPPASLMGVWNVTLAEGEEAGGHEFLMSLRLTGDSVTGTVQFEKHAGAVFDGSWHDGNLVLVVGSSKDKTWYLTLRGALRQDGSLAGTVEEYDNGKRTEGTFEARR